MHAPDASSVRVAGSWDSWRDPGADATRLTPGLWHVTLPSLASGTHAYKFVIDGDRWISDPLNRGQSSDGLGGWNSTIAVG